ncbi:MAG: hypothetical protein ABEJ77_00545 [Halanaeroarchaeum sp.]
MTDDERKRTVLREVAADLRGPDASSASEKLAATIVRASDLYDPAADTSPEEIYRNMRVIFEIEERGGRDFDEE